MSASVFLESVIQKKKRGFIDLDVLACEKDAPSLEDLYVAITSLVEQGSVVPTKSSKRVLISSGFVPLRYKIVQKRPDRSWLLKLHPKLLENGYCERNADKVSPYLPHLVNLSAWMRLPDPEEGVTLRERSLEIFGYEKVFEDGSGEWTGLAACLRRLGVTNELLRVSRFPNTFAITFRKGVIVANAITHIQQPTILICENRDIWLHVRSLLRAGDRVCGTMVDVAILGMGNSITAANGDDLVECLDEYGLADSQPALLYWGDIDRPGVDIALRLQSVLKEKFYDVRPFGIGYKFMLDWAARHDLPECPSSTLYDRRHFLAWIDDLDLSSTQMETYLSTLEDNRRIPQEAVTMGVLKSVD